MSNQPAPKRRIPPVIPILAILGIGAFAAWKFLLAPPKVPENVVAVSGRIEGDDAAVAAKTSGRILEIHFREGDSVKAGDVVAVLDDQQLRARVDQAQAAVVQSAAQLRSAQQQIPVLEQQFEETRLQAGQANVDSQGRVRQAQAELAAAEAELAQQKAALQLALFDKDAYTRLARNGAVSERQGKQAVTTAESQQAMVAATARKVEAARASVNVAQASLSNSGIRNLQGAGIRNRILQQQSQIADSQAGVQRAQAQLAEAQVNLRDLTVRAPFDGTVVTRAAEPGEVVQAGTAIITLLDLKRVYLRGFVPEGQIGKVKLHQAARIFLDSNPNQAVDAEVARIDPQATFTPENTYFRDDRVKQVVGVKMQLKGAFGFAKPGMPADGEILISGDQWPAWKPHK